MICANCGNWVEDGASNCPGCGAPVMAQEAAPGQQMNMGQPGNGMPDGGQPAGGMGNGNPSPRSSCASSLQDAELLCTY